MGLEGPLVDEGEVQPAEADRAYYHFQQFVLRLADCSEQDSQYSSL